MAPFYGMNINTYPHYTFDQRKKKTAHAMNKNQCVVHTCETVHTCEPMSIKNAKEIKIHVAPT